MLIAEIFQSRQGEGRLTGTESVFVRFSGCNLRCWYCDTPYTSWAPEGISMTRDEIIHTVQSYSASHIVITGGEPMIVAGLPELCHSLHALGKHLTIETAGTQFQGIECDLMSISPKLSNSTPSFERGGSWRARHDASRHRPDVIRQLTERFDYQVKFVVDIPSDLGEIDRYLEKFPDIEPSHVWLMPQGIELDELRRREDWLRPHCEQRGFQVCSRKHIEWYGNVRGT